MRVELAKLDRAFNPKCVVVVGDSRATNFEWLRGQSKFTGKLYSVQVNPETIELIRAMGVKNYTSLLDIPEPVDLAIIGVSRSAAAAVLDDCVRKGVAAAHFFTAGFAETQTEEGIKLERLLKDKAEAANFHLIGPNCLGLFNPGIGIRQSEEQYTGVSGPVGFVSQSGTYAIRFSLEAHLQGVDINKSVSFGNGIMLDSPDFLEYFGRDPKIKAIGMYLEGVRDGRRFFKVLREVAGRKPVLVWKGGRTEEGGRAIASHTGALAVARSIWDAAIRQAGAIGVAGMEEMIDTLKALLYLQPVRSDRVGIAGGSGGHSVSIADIFVETGLKVPQLTRESHDEFATFFNPVGGSYRNPIDTAGPVRRDMKRIMEALEKDANIDNLVYMVSTKPGWHMRDEQLQSNLELVEYIKKRTSKPFMAIVFFSTTDAEKESREIILKLQDMGVPAFPSIERGALALRNAFNYWRLKG